MISKISFLASCMLVLSAGDQASQAETTIEPVGFIKVTALGNSDTRFSVPLHRSAKFQEVVHSVTGNTITVQGTPSWSTSELVYAAGAQANTYYISFTSGNREGMYYTVTANTTASGANTATLILDLNGDTIDSTGGVVPGDQFKVIPYWTLSTLFSGQQGITGTTAAGGGGAATKILFPDLVSIGINHSTIGIYFYYTGTGGSGPSWRQVGSGIAIKNDQIVIPDSYLVVRQDGVNTNTSLIPTGSVPLGTRRYVLGTLQANVAQDTAAALDIPIPLTLSSSQLFESGAFKGSTSISGNTGDKLYTFDDEAIGYNKIGNAEYYFYIGSSFGGSGWRRSGAGLTAIKNNEEIFRPGAGFIIRKQAEAAPSSQIWTIPLPY